MLASRTNAARSAPLNNARKHESLLKLYKVETKENPNVEQRSKIRRLDTAHDQIDLKKSRKGGVGRGWTVCGKDSKLDMSKTPPRCKVSSFLCGLLPDPQGQFISRGVT